MWLLSPATEYRFSSVWVETGWWNGTYHRGLKDSLGYRDPNADAPLWSWQEFRASGTAYGPEVLSQPANTGNSYTCNQGDWLEFVRPSTDNIWNLDRSGKRRHARSETDGRDFAPASTVGRNYLP